MAGKPIEPVEEAVDGELAVAHEDNFMRTHGGPHQVLVDKTGFLEGITFPMGEFKPKPPDAGAINLTLTWFPRQMRIALKTMARGKLPVAATGNFESPISMLNVGSSRGGPD